MCFTIPWLVSLLVWLVVLCVVVALVRIWILPMLASTDPRIPATINIIIWAVVVIFVLYAIVDILMCIGGGGVGFGFSRTR